MTSPAGATGLTARLPAAVTGKRGRMLIGTGAVVVALAVGTGIVLGTRKAKPDPSLTGVQSRSRPPRPPCCRSPRRWWCGRRSPRRRRRPPRRRAPAANRPRSKPGSRRRRAGRPGSCPSRRHRLPARRPDHDHEEAGTPGRSPHLTPADLRRGAPAVGLVDREWVTGPARSGGHRCPSVRPRAPAVFASAVPGCRHGVGRRIHAQPRARRRRRCSLRPEGARLTEAEPALAAQAAAQGRWDAVGASGIAHLQRAAGNAGVTAALGEEDRSPVHDVVSSGGRALDPDVRADMEGRLGHDFGDVRVHDDAVPTLGRRGQRERLHGRLQHRVPARPLRPEFQRRQTHPRARADPRRAAAQRPGRRHAGDGGSGSVTRATGSSARPPPTPNG